MEEDRYYVPDISEFCHGFEYETSINTKDWHTHIFNITEENLWLQEFKNPSFEKYIRVKCLSKKDIESLGFVFIAPNEDHHSGYYIRKTELIELTITEFPAGKNTFIIEDDNCLFMSLKIRNKNELEKILKMIV